MMRFPGFRRMDALLPGSFPEGQTIPVSSAAHDHSRDSQNRGVQAGRDRTLIVRVLLKLLCCGVFLILCLPGSVMGLQSGPAGLQAVSPDEQESLLQYFEGLRERRLYELIEVLCQRKLDDPELPETERLFYQVELARTYAEHAQQVPLQEAREYWSQAENMLQELPRDSPVRELELALLLGTQAESLFWLLRADPASLALREEFLRIANGALTRLEQILGRLTQRTPRTPAETDPRLQEHRPDEVRLAQGRLHLFLAEVQYANVPERTLHLKSGRDVLNPLVRRTQRGRLELEAQLWLIMAARLEKNKSEAESLWKNLNHPAVPVALRHRGTAEYARFLLEHQQQPTAVADIILQQGQDTGFLSSELEQLRLQALLDMSVQVREKGDVQLARELEQEVEQRLDRLDARGDAYHARLVRNHRAQLSLKAELGPEIAPLVASARRAAAEGGRARASEIYQDAVQRAVRTGKAGIAMQVVKEAARHALQENQFAAAADMLEQVWRMSPAYSGIEEIHLLWIQTLGRDYLADRTTARLTRYQQALEDHLQRYQGKSTEAEALWLLAELQFARLQVTRALELYAQVPSDSPRGVSAQLRQGQCYQWILQRVRDLQQPTAEWEQRLRDFAQRVLEQRSQQTIDSPAAGELVVLACRILLEQSAIDPETLRRHLQTVLEACLVHLQEAPAEAPETRKWKATQQAALGLRAVSLAQRGRVLEAQDLLTQPGTSPETPTEILFLLRQLSADQASSSPEAQVALAELQLKLSDDLHGEWRNNPQVLNAPDARDLLKLRAEAHRQAGRITPALQHYRQLLQLLPGDRPTLQRLSQLYDECGSPECHEQHYQLWQQQLRGEKQGSPTWLEARYQIARLALQTGRHEEARKIVQMTRLLYPQADSPAWQALGQQLENIPR